MDDGFVDLHLTVAQVDLPPLEGVVHLLGDAEKIGRPMDDPPAGLDARAVHQQRQGSQQLCHATAGIGRIDVDHMEMPERFGFLSDPLNLSGSHELLIVFQLHKLLRTHPPFSPFLPPRRIARVCG